MKSRRFVLGLFGAIVLIASVSYVYSCPGRATRIYRRAFMGGNYSVQDLQFRDVLVVDGVTVRGQRFYDITIKASDCVTIEKIGENFGTESAAEMEFEERIRKSYRLVGRGPKLDVTGHKIGERAVVLLRPLGWKAAIYWKEGGGLQTLESSSLAHILEYEKRNPIYVPRTELESEGAAIGCQAP